MQGSIPCPDCGSRKRALYAEHRELWCIYCGGGPFWVTKDPLSGAVLGAIKPPELPRAPRSGSREGTDWDDLPIGPPQNPLLPRILDLMSSRVEHVTISAIGKALHVTNPEVRTVIEELLEDGIIQPVTYGDGHGYVGYRLRTLAVAIGA